MIGKKINQLATELAPVSTDLTIIGDPTTGVSKKITLAQLGAIFSGAVSFYTNLAGFPATGDINVIYCAKDTQKLYLWSGSAYVEVFPSQALLNTYQLRSEKGVSNGYASLDSAGKVPVSQLPSSIMEYKGMWNAATNTPTLANGTGDTGDVYICNVAGTVNFGAGPITFAVGDYVIYSGTIWQRSSGAVGTVTSVAASITGNAIGITGSPVTTSGTLAFAFAGTGAQYIKGDGTLATFPNTISQAEKLITEVYNSTGATLTKGTIVYINGGQGNLPTVTKALATGDSTSAQTFGVVQADITNNNNGYVVVAGKLSDLDTQAYTEGTQLYLSSTTAGAWTSTKQYAPNHLVYIGIVVRAHPTQGIVEIKIQNGYEMDELHNVAAQTPTNNDGLFWESATSLWKNKSIATILGGTPVTGSGTLYALTKWGFTSGTIINSNLYDTGSVIYNNNATAGAFAVQFNGNATSGMSYGLLINAGSDANDIALRIQNVSSTSEYFFVYGDGKVKMNNIPNATTDTDTFLVSDGGFIKYRTGAQLLSDIGGQAALTNPVTGTGTTNYLPKFTGTSTIGNSGITDDGTTVTYGAGSGLKQIYINGGGYDLILGASGGGVFGFTSTNISLVFSTTAKPLGIGTNAAQPLIFGTSAAERMRLDASGNLGLGVTPSAWNSGLKVQQIGYSAFVLGSGSEQAIIGSNWFQNTSASNVYLNNGFATFYQQASGQHQFFTAPSGTAGNAISFTQAMTLNASGRLLLGTTTDSGDVFQVADGSVKIVTTPYSPTGVGFFGTSSNHPLSIITNGSTRLTIASTGAATFSSSVTAGGKIFTSASVADNIIEVINSDTTNGYGLYVRGGGTASNRYVARFKNGADSDVMWVGTSNVGIGTTSPATALHVYNASQGVARFESTQGEVNIALNNSSASGNLIGTVGANFYFYSGGSERLRITSGGRVGIGTTSPTSILNISGVNADAAIDWTNTTASTGRSYRWVSLNSGGFAIEDLTASGAERMRITSGGDIAIGDTSASARLWARRTDDGNTFGVRATNASYSATVGFFGADRNTTNNSFYYIDCYNYGSSSYRFRVADSGNVTNTNNSYGAISDISLKENISDTTSKLADLLKVRVRNYNLIGDDKKQIGVIAQELETIFPSMIDTDVNTGLKSVKYSVFVPMLIKGMQELKAELDTLKNK